MSMLYKILDWCRWLFGVVPKSAIGSPRVYLIAHYAFIAVITIVLALPPVSDFVKKNLLNTTQLTLPDFIDRSWAAFLFILLYGLVRSVLFLVSLFGIEEQSEFEDIDEDWREILNALRAERLPIDNLPLFIVNGFTPEQEKSAFESAVDDRGAEGWKVIAPPLNRKSVLRLFGSDDALYLCTSGIGVTSCQQGKVDNSLAPSSSSSGNNIGTGTVLGGFGSPAGRKPASAGGTMAAGFAPPKEPATTPAMAPESAPPRDFSAAPFMGTMMPGAIKKAMQTFTSSSGNTNKGFGRRKVLPVTDLERLVGERRMRFLCERIATARRPWCGINGMLQAIPLSWASSVDYAKPLARAIQADVAAVHTGLNLQFPLIAMITELDDVSGVREFILRGERVQSGLRLSRAGSSFPCGNELERKNAEWIVDRAMQWFRGWVYRAFSADLDNRENPKLFQMICELGARRDALVVLLREAFYRSVSPTVRLYGVYFSATGRVSTEQGFLRGVLHKLPESQDEVAWTPALINKRKRHSLIAILLFALSASALAATAFLIMKIRATNG
jgi:hypothetical protein